MYNIKITLILFITHPPNSCMKFIPKGTFLSETEKNYERPLKKNRYRKRKWSTAHLHLHVGLPSGVFPSDF
jgi:hypothetical protein